MCLKVIENMKSNLQRRNYAHGDCSEVAQDFDSSGRLPGRDQASFQPTDPNEEGKMGCRNWYCGAFYYSFFYWGQPLD